MILSKLRNLFNTISKCIDLAHAKSFYTPTLKLAEIILNENEEYIVTIQMINKNILFNAKPEEILAKDTLVDQFSPKDIRTLTYLGYLGINSPKYKILAKRLSEEHDKMVFAIKKKGDKRIIVKTADEILKEEEILNSLKPGDAQMIGYTIASESIIAEKRDKELLLEEKFAK